MRVALQLIDHALSLDQAKRIAREGLETSEISIGGRDLSTRRPATEPPPVMSDAEVTRVMNMVARAAGIDLPADNK